MQQSANIKISHSL